MEEKTKIIKKRLVSKKIKKLTEGLLSTAIDLTLFSLYLPLCSFNKSPSSRGVYQTFKETDEMLFRLNYQTLKRSLYKLREQGFIESIKDWVNEPIITQAGLRRLQTFLPKYQEKRPWDGKLYLINYDIPRDQNYLRNRFRDFLKKLGAIKLQDSLYFAANNPYKFIKQFREENNITGTILVSELGRRGFIEEENLKRFLWRIANLDSLNEHYRLFLEKWRNVKDKIAKTQLAIEYYSILKYDPQLPFEVLAEDYLGDEAYLLFQKLLKTP